MGDRIDAYVSLGHYWAHLKPIMDALPDELRGHVYGPSPADRLIGGRNGTAPDSTMPLLVAGFQDLGYSRRPKVLVQHGAGQRYAGVDSPSFAGGPHHELADLHIVPSVRVGELEHDRYPHAQIAVVGSPKLDGWAKIRKPRNDPPVIAFTFHWPSCIKDADDVMLPEAGSALPTWRATVERFVKAYPGQVLGHAHPRAARELSVWWASLGVEFVPDAADLLPRADCLVLDNSSLGFEWAALDRSTVWLRGADWTGRLHGPPRFHGPGEIPLPGPELGAWCFDSWHDPVRELRDCINMSLTRYVLARMRCAHEVFDRVDGLAAKRAAEAVLRLVP